MTRAYSLSDTAPKDSGGAKFLAFPDINTSQLDFALPAGIGASTIGGGSKVHAGLQIGTHVAGSQINDNAPLGVLPVLAYTSNPSTMAINNAIPWRGDQRGQAFISGLSTVTCAMGGASTETVTVASGILYKVFMAGTQVNGGASAVVLNGGTSLANFIFSSTSETLPVFDLGIHGACFGSLRVERRNTTGAIFFSCNYSTWGQ